MARESLTAQRQRAHEIEERMFARYGEGECSLDYRTPFELLVATILSAQCTDAAVNRITPTLFAKWPDPQAMAQAPFEDVSETIRSLGFFRSKAKNVIACAQMILTDFDGEVPADADALQTLPGVGRKTANCVMCEAFKDPQGIAVDTHVNRIAHRLRFATRNDDTPNKVEQKLLKVFPRDEWGYVNHQWVHFGREYCTARNPKCADCIVADLCPSCQA